MKVHSKLLVIEYLSLIVIGSTGFTLELARLKPIVLL